MKLKAVFVGLLTVDLQFFIENYPKENEKVKAKDFDFLIGGPATNASVTFNHLGGDAHLVSSVGQSVFTEVIRKDLDEYAIHLTDIIENHQQYPVFASVISNVHSGDRTIFSYHPAASSIEHLDIETLLDGAHIVLTDGFYPELAIECAKAAKSKGIPVVFDGGSWKTHLPDLLPHIDIAICSSNFIPPDTNSKEQVLDFLIHSGVNQSAITAGGGDILFGSNKQTGSIKVQKTEVVDTLGAGDIFHGAFCYYYAINHNLQDALYEASVVAGYSCGFKGTRSWMKKRQTDQMP